MFPLSSMYLFNHWMSSRLSWYLALESFSIYNLCKRYLDLSDDAKFFKRVLEYLEVGYEFIVEFGSPINLVHWDSLAEPIVKELTIDRSASQIFNSLDIQVETLIDPLYDFLSGDEVGLVHEADDSSVMVHEIDRFGC